MKPNKKTKEKDMKNRVMGKFISEVYKIASENHGCTAGEIFIIYQAKYPGTLRSRGEIAKRLSDLMDQGLVYKSLATTCSYSGATVSTWEVNPLPKGLSLSQVDAEQRSEDVTNSSDDRCGGCCGCGHDDDEDDAYDDEEEDVVYDEVKSMPRHEKAERITELAGEKCLAVDPEDLAMLRDCYNAIQRVDSDFTVKTVVSLIPGMKEKTEKLKKALRYFA